jgi:hypothetical protein
MQKNEAGPYPAFSSDSEIEYYLYLNKGDMDTHTHTHTYHFCAMVNDSSASNLKGKCFVRDTKNKDLRVHD